MLPNLTLKFPPVYNFAESANCTRLEGEDLLFQKLVATEAFERMKSIRFLGGIDYLLIRSPNGKKGNIRHTRYQHSLGVARLALKYCDLNELDSVNRKLLYSAALLHDIGHAPLSHSLEPVFLDQFGIGHHQATENIITGRVNFGKGIFKILKESKVDVEHLISILAGEESEYDGFFSSPINFDTIDGILRTQEYQKSSSNLRNPDLVTSAAFNRSGEADRAVVDEFWTFKNLVYRNVINSPKGALADLACQVYMRKNLNKIVLNDYFSTENAMFQKLPGLRDLLASRNFYRDFTRYLKGPIRYSVRQFYIDETSNFFDREDNKRYRQSKIEKIMKIDKLDSHRTYKESKDLFGDVSARTSL